MRVTIVFARRAALVAALTLCGDQALKALVREQLAVCATPPLAACDRLGPVGPLTLVRIENAGSALGFGQGLPHWLILAALGLILIPVYGSRLRACGWPGMLAVGFQAGGALGNLLDRLVAGEVVDPLALRPLPLVVNAADLAIVSGMLLASALLLRSPAVAATPPRITRDCQQTVRLPSAGRPADEGHAAG